MDQVRQRRLFTEAEAERWSVPPAAFAAALERSAAKAFTGRTPSDGDLDRYFGSLHLTDLALACACAAGDDAAWDHFVTEFRPALYRAADAIDASGGAREVADALYAELYGLKERDGERRSLFDYFHGRSSLATWLRSLLSQRYVDRFRQTRRLEALPEDASAAALTSRDRSPNPDRPRFETTMRAALNAAVAALDPRDRLRLGCYYAEEMTLAQIGKLTREHEATVSRQLARTRRAIRTEVERRLRADHHFAEPEIAECFASIVNDAGALDLAEWLSSPKRGLGAAEVGKKSVDDRSRHEDPS